MGRNYFNVIQLARLQDNKELDGHLYVSVRIFLRQVEPQLIQPVGSRIREKREYCKFHFHSQDILTDLYEVPGGGDGRKVATFIQLFGRVFLGVVFYGWPNQVSGQYPNIYVCIFIYVHLLTSSPLHTPSASLITIIQIQINVLSSLQRNSEQVYHTIYHAMIYLPNHKFHLRFLLLSDARYTDMHTHICSIYIDYYVQIQYISTQDYRFMCPLLRHDSATYSTPPLRIVSPLHGHLMLTITNTQAMHLHICTQLGSTNIRHVIVQDHDRRNQHPVTLCP